MSKLLRNFIRRENGAVTVDWVVLTAAIVGVAIVAYVEIENQTHLLGEATAGAIGGENDF
ncbi:hypothetical protein PGB28_08235 [Primorskyibacter aestuariivivens]|uniref:hypothetical protein n=1 Tax=Primorskyibacter aestuariivivens TaxID=1888912 RepID=UPI00230145B4|nr:hypothetical protein [Primorskyibacter aestuariivivens]MDA7428445.1 hypothetical protein [Primorskyibacter aestuariivivens]